MARYLAKQAWTVDVTALLFSIAVMSTAMLKILPAVFNTARQHRMYGVIF